MHGIQPDRMNRSRGALLGLAVGDAIGTTVEFMTRGSFPPVTDMVGGGPFRLLPGQFTDDTSMALCLGASLLENGFDLDDQMLRYLRWRDQGYMSSNGLCFDIGNATSDALDAFNRSGDALSGSIDFYSAGNGSVMRLAPVPIRYQDDQELALRLCVEQSRTTHQAPECLAACHLLGQILLRALGGSSKAAVLKQLKVEPHWSKGIIDISIGTYKRKTSDQFVGSGYVVHSLEAALWCFFNSSSFSECVLLAVNLGDDADTTAAIAGQIAGAFYGESGIPSHWLARLAMGDEIGQMAQQLALLGLNDEGMAHES